jgi:hypothetical protein
MKKNTKWDKWSLKDVNDCKSDCPKKSNPPICGKLIWWILPKNQKKDGRISLGAFKVYMDLAPTSPWPPQNTHTHTHTKQQKGQSLQFAYREEQFV